MTGRLNYVKSLEGVEFICSAHNPRPRGPGTPIASRGPLVHLAGCCDSVRLGQESEHPAARHDRKRVRTSVGMY
jgi:hypothetical protein